MGPASTARPRAGLGAVWEVGIDLPQLCASYVYGRGCLASGREARHLPFVCGWPKHSLVGGLTLMITTKCTPRTALDHTRAGGCRVSARHGDAVGSKAQQANNGWPLRHGR